MLQLFYEVINECDSDPYYGFKKLYDYNYGWITLLNYVLDIIELYFNTIGLKLLRGFCLDYCKLLTCTSVAFVMRYNVGEP